MELTRCEMFSIGCLDRLTDSRSPGVEMLAFNRCNSVGNQNGGKKAGNADRVSTIFLASRLSRRTHPQGAKATTASTQLKDRALVDRVPPPLSNSGRTIRIRT